METDPIADRLRAKAQELGFDRLAFVPAGPARDAHRLRTWLDSGRHGDMTWMARTEPVRDDVRRLLPGARTVVCLLTFYYTRPEGDAAAWEGRVSRYAWGRDYHNVLGRRLRRLARFVADTWPGERAVPAVDAKPVLEKDWAERSGLGWIGKHTNLIAADRGSWFFLSELVTTLDVPAAIESPAAERCGRCTACLEACPTRAIVAPWQVDARRCISYLTIELDGPIPPELRPLVGEWIFGCDVCQDVCPWNRFAVPVTEPAFALDRGRFDGDLAGFLGLDEETFRNRFEGSPVRRAGRDGFLRNVCVALGNRRDPETLPALAAALHDGSALVRAHAAWALGRIGGDPAGQALVERLGGESDEGVRREIGAALEDLGDANG
jgi:epoxyqueuosine reductase